MRVAGRQYYERSLTPAPPVAAAPRGSPKPAPPPSPLGGSPVPAPQVAATPRERPRARAAGSRCPNGAPRCPRFRPIPSRSQPAQSALSLTLSQSPSHICSLFPFLQRIYVHSCIKMMRSMFWFRMEYGRVDILAAVYFILHKKRKLGQFF